MNAIDAIHAAARDTGYRDEAVIRNYPFADILDASSATRSVPLVAFTQTPPSYRSAALAVVEGGDHNVLDLVRDHRALGAPLLFVISPEYVTVWQVRTSDPPRVIDREKTSDIPALFQRHRGQWNPNAIHRAKSIGAAERTYQLDFVDLGLLPAIEGEIHVKLDRLLVDTLSAASSGHGSSAIDMRTLFRVVFRLLAAKVLQDRRHPYAANWDATDLKSVLGAIEAYYTLPQIAATRAGSQSDAYKACWETILNGISFSNISSDDLAFVYENTLVTPEARKLFGTHSTPRQVAEYIVQRMEIHKFDIEGLRIYEPFAGAGVFLVSALRHLRDTLPVEWSDQTRHDYLVQRISGDEFDSFACEVAMLSLILADYPNRNGWHINEYDLFQKGALSERMRGNNIILCNPPFETFNEDEKQTYSFDNTTYSKPLTVINAALDAKPQGLGFILPRPMILGQQYSELRRRVEGTYAKIELVELPDRTFGASKIEAAALIATDILTSRTRTQRVRSTEIADWDRAAFLKTGIVTSSRESVRHLDGASTGDLWIPALSDLWEYLRSNPPLSSVLAPSRGLEWNYHQEDAASEQPRDDFRKGLHSARKPRQFIRGRSVWLDYRRESVRRGYGQNWEAPKIIMNASRLSRASWRIAAFPDFDGLLYSQQFYGLWPRISASAHELTVFCAILNGPLANAYIAVHSPENRIRAKAIERIPIPQALPDKVYHLASLYMELADSRTFFEPDELELQRILVQIDAAVLKAYDLPPKLEDQLLSFFLENERPVVHPWQHWDVTYPARGLTLAERLSGRFSPKNQWVTNLFKPLPEEEAALLRDYGS